MDRIVVMIMLNHDTHEAYIFVKDVFPIRQSTGTSVERSAYSPPVKLLSEELSLNSIRVLDNISLTLTGVNIHSSTLATFHFESSSHLSINPGQAAVIDFIKLLGTQQYAHMSPGKEVSLNDDRVRTWTVSSCHNSETRNLSLTMREKPRGLVTGALFALAHQAAKKMPHILLDARPLGLSVDLVGISGSFTLPPEVTAHKLLCFAGGVGITPFLSILGSANLNKYLDIIFILSTNEPDIFIRMVSDALPQSLMANVVLHVFTRKDIRVDLLLNDRVEIVKYDQRLNRERLFSIAGDALELLIYVCGPVAFENMVIKTLGDLGVNHMAVIKDGFAY